MSDTIIHVENLSKKYMIGHQTQSGNTTLREKIANGARSIFRSLLEPSINSSLSTALEEFWALKDVSFQIKQGERIGIIGRNGAGKSTLLKIMSRITEPTSGQIVIRGRVASLLEVGTGFHSELTGRENVFLNGAILGMSMAEIRSRFDEIIDFSGVEQFLDTPVKRYSSGMYVRLAFAIAAHLDPEIFIVDEVLAVGDSEFQKKCLGKMQDMSKTQERTVLFVSHNLDAIQRLCSSCVMLERGQLVAYSDTDSIVTRYLTSYSFKASPNEWIDISDVNRFGTREAYFTAILYSSLNEAAGFLPYSNGPLEFSLAISSNASRVIESLAVTIYDRSGFKLVNIDTLSLSQTISLRKGHNVVRLRIERLYLNPGVYVLGLWLANTMGTVSKHAVLDYIESMFEIEVVNLKSEGLGARVDSDGVVMTHFRLVDIS